MSHEQVCNELQRIFGRVIHFDHISTTLIDFSVEGWHRQFSAMQNNEQSWSVMERTGDDLASSNYSEWVQGLLHGMRRNDAGELVKRGYTY